MCTVNNFPNLIILGASHGVAGCCITFVTIFCLVACLTVVVLLDFVSVGPTISHFLTFVPVDRFWYCS